MPNKALGYGRVSTLKQVQQGTSLAEQQERNWMYGCFLGTKFPGLIVPNKESLTFIDAAVTSDLFLMERPAGSALCAQLQHGDHMIISLFDRAFRSSVDLEQVLTFTKMRGVYLHILDFPYDMSTPEGQLVMGIVACVKRFEKQNIKERITRGIRRSFADGRPPSTAPLGWKMSKSKIGRYRKPIPDLEYRSIAEEIVRLHDVEGLSHREIYWKFLRERRKRTRIHGQRIPEGREWSFGTIQNAYRAAKAGFPKQSILSLGLSESESETTAGPSTATPSLPPPEA